MINPVGGAPKKSTVNATSLLPMLQFLLQQNAMQKEQLIKLIKYVEQTSGCQTSVSDVGTSDLPQLSLASSRERELQAYLAHLQLSIGKLSEEVQRLKLKNVQVAGRLQLNIYMNHVLITLEQVLDVLYDYQIEQSQYLHQVK